jgi:hypothetical protein
MVLVTSGVLQYENGAPVLASLFLRLGILIEATLIMIILTQMLPV